jgi:hypothetical protein
MQQIARRGILHDHQHVLRRVKHFQQPNHVWMLYLFQNVDLLEYFATREVILHVVFVNCLDGHIATCKFVHSESYLPEGSLAYEFHKLVKFK